MSGHEEHRFLVLKWDDIRESLTRTQANFLDAMLADVGDYRRKTGRLACPDYYVVNQDEPYSDEVKSLIFGQPFCSQDEYWAGTPEQEIETLREMVEQRDAEIEQLRQQVEAAEEG